ncbi:MAG TPA: hypothetical protein VMV37_11715 [Gammaproteobacteria bacterium]|nr:hypothetical protein [Gammaproteobacteria bacterium]
MNLPRKSLAAAALAAGVALAACTAPVPPAGTPAQTAPPTATSRAQSQVHGDLRQVMRGVLFPNSNVVFFAQGTDPASVPKDADGTTSVNPLASVYGGWEAIENSSIALAEAANLLTIPGRTCANGKPAPVQSADWQRFVQGLRDAGMASYKAAQTKDMDKMLDAADTLTNACSDCHDVYREKTEQQGGDAARCTAH